MSDEALQTAWRAACATPDDAQVRRAYAAQLERVGHRAAAFVERSMASMLEGSEAPEPPLLDPTYDREERRIVAPLPWPELDVVAPDRDDAHLPGAGVIGPEAARLGLASAPTALVPWPSCRGGCAQGALECDACSGRGTIQEFTGRAELRVACDDCSGRGHVRCEACAGWDLDPEVRDGCEHPTPWPVERELSLIAPRPGSALVAAFESGILGEAGELTREHLVVADSGVTWSLLRCPTCGLTALRRDPEGDEYPACPECGHFRCICGLGRI